MTVNSLQVTKLGGSLGLATFVPIWLILRALVDGSTYLVLGLKLTELSGLLLFAISVFLVMRFALAGHLIFSFVTLLILMSSIQGFYNWGSASLQEFLRTLGIVGIFLTTLRNQHDRYLNRFFRALKFLAITNGTLIICQYLFLGGGYSVSNVTRYKGFMFSANTAAILFCCYLISEANNLHRQSKYSRIPAIVISLIGLYFTFSFGGYIFLMVGLYITLILSTQNKFRKTSIFTVVVVASFFTLYINSPGIRGKYYSVLAPVLAGNANGSSSLQWRFDSWKSFFPYFTEKPVIGQGYGSTQNLNMAGPYLPHNEYIRFIVEGGLLGVTIFILIFTALVMRLKTIWKTTNSSIARYALVLTITWMVSALSENSFTYTVPQYILAASIGFSLNIERSRMSNSRMTSAIQESNLEPTG